MKKNGSALILCILILAFFTTMSMNIYYIGQKKAETAGDKRTGEQLTNDIDIASSIVYQEAYIAENFVRTGFVYNYPEDIEHSWDEYELKDGDNPYLNSSFSYVKKYAGIQLSDISEYFDSNWDYTKGDKDEQKLIISEVVKNGEVKSRIWQSGGVPDKMTKLWEDSGKLSIGGYKLKSIAYFDPDNPGTVLDLDDLSEGKVYSVKAVFEKTVEMVGNDYIPTMSFKLTATETVNMDTSLGTDLDKVDYYGQKISLEIEKLNG